MIVLRRKDTTSQKTASSLRCVGRERERERERGRTLQSGSWHLVRAMEAPRTASGASATQMRSGRRRAESGCVWTRQMR